MMANLSITRKMMIAFGGIMLVTILAAGFIIYQTSALLHHVERNAQNSEALDALLDYRDVVEAAHSSVLRLVNSSDISHLAAIEKALEDMGRRETDLRTRGGEGGGGAQAIDALIQLLRRWQTEIVEYQIVDMRDPYTVDMARLREASVENATLWREIDDRLATIIEALKAEQTTARDAQDHELGLLQAVSIGSSALLMAICLLMSFVVRGSVVAPLRRLAGVTERLRDKDWEVTIGGTERGDEIGEMSRALEVFRDNGKRNEEIEREQARDAETKARNAEAVRRAIDAFRDSSGTLLGQLGHAGHTLGSAATSLQSVAGHSHDYTVSCSHAAEATEASVQNVAAAIEEMSMSIRDISQQLQNVTHLTERTTQASAQAGQKVTGLKARSDKIHEVVDLITSIAGQINLLALNATIESARAGEAGKGFAVVAQQVKQLADQTAKATEDISRVIGQVSGEVNEVVQAIQIIDHAIGEVNTNTAGVAAAVEEQSAALDEISRNVTVVTTQTGNVAENVKGVEEKVGETSKVAGEVNELSTSLKESSNRLGTTIESFIGAVSSRSVAPARA
ncbi:methyl-accepting chemotaxis protein [Acuticoccus kandeliae]|uniref:methyl-accepting chemotaxis protein n=1 Tax=Acuticoccus kandeliae TaxID=2073160 RepID=UPI000D3EB0DC|nr:HAMP domain-containing methyl-accepting chemotaxis protein [Acuticoccus kandeliae]